MVPLPVSRECGEPKDTHKVRTLAWFAWSIRRQMNMTQRPIFVYPIYMLGLNRPMYIYVVSIHSIYIKH